MQRSYSLDCIDADIGDTRWVSTVISFSATR
jgi:hypothetical protein